MQSLRYLNVRPLLRASSSNANSATFSRFIRLGSSSTSVSTHINPKESHAERTWSEHQARRQDQMKNPRFADIDLKAQPLPIPAIDLISREPIIKVQTRVVSCDGGHVGLGHPKVFINLDKPGSVGECMYCGTRFAYEDPHHHH